MFTTSNPMPVRVPTTTLHTISPERRESRPTTMVFDVLVVVRRMNVAYADVNLTRSSGVSESPAGPPIVPLIPEIDLINDILL